MVDKVHRGRSQNVGRRSAVADVETAVLSEGLDRAGTRGIALLVLCW